MSECIICNDPPNLQTAIKCDLDKCEMIACVECWAGVINKNLCPLCRRPAQMKYGMPNVGGMRNAGEMPNMNAGPPNVLRLEVFALERWITYTNIGCFIIGALILFYGISDFVKVTPPTLNQCGGRTLFVQIANTGQKSSEGMQIPLDKILVCDEQQTLCQTYKCNLECYDAEEKLCYNSKHHSICQKMTDDYASQTTLTKSTAGTAYRSGGLKTEREIFYSMCRKIVSIDERLLPGATSPQDLEPSPFPATSPKDLSAKENKQSKPITEATELNSSTENSCAICSTLMDMVHKIGSEFLMLAIFGLVSTLTSVYNHRRYMAMLETLQV